MAARKLRPCYCCQQPTYGVTCSKCRAFREQAPIEQLMLMAEHGDRERAAHRLTAWTANAKRIWNEMGVAS